MRHTATQGRKLKLEGKIESSYHHLSSERFLHGFRCPSNGYHMTVLSGTVLCHMTTLSSGVLGHLTIFSGGVLGHVPILSGTCTTLPRGSRTAERLRYARIAGFAKRMTNLSLNSDHTHAVFDTNRRAQASAQRESEFSVRQESGGHAAVSASRQCESGVGGRTARVWNVSQESGRHEGSVRGCCSLFEKA